MDLCTLSPLKQFLRRQDNGLIRQSYLILFICLSSKAVYLKQLIVDLTTKEILNALRRATQFLIIRKVSGELFLTLGEMRSYLTKIEAVLNSNCYPSTQLSNKSNDLTAPRPDLICTRRSFHGAYRTRAAGPQQAENIDHDEVKKPGTHYRRWDSSLAVVAWTYSWTAISTFCAVRSART